MSNLLDSIKSYITPDLIGQAAQLLGESEGGVSKAIGSLAPTLLAGLLHKSSDANVMGTIFSGLSKFDPSVLDNLSGLIGGGNLAHNDPKDASGHLLGTIFGAKVPAITNAISSFAGVKASSTSSLLGMVGPLVMGLLSKKISTDGLNVSGLANFLLSQKNAIMSALPAGLSSILGLADLSGTVDGTTVTPPASASGMRWFLPLVLLLVAGFGIMYYMKSCSKPAAKAEVIAPVVAPVTMPAEPVAPAKFTMTLPTGYEVVGSPMGIEAMLLKFIQSPDSLPGKTNWFDFDNLLFQTASDQLDMEKSKTQLTNVFEILKAYPNVKVKIGGYTDNVGDPKKNKDLSDRRAKNVLAELVKMGIVKDRLTAEGYGQENPVASNATDEGKARNRRVSVSVRAK